MTLVEKQLFVPTSNFKQLLLKGDSNNSYKSQATKSELPAECTQKLYAIYIFTNNIRRIQTRDFLTFIFDLLPGQFSEKFQVFFSPSYSSNSSFSFFCISFPFLVCFTFFAICLQSIAAGTHFCMQLDTLTVVFDAIPLQQQLVHNALSTKGILLLIVLFYDFMTVVLICYLVTL